MTEQKSVVVTTEAGVSRVDTTEDSVYLIETAAPQGPPGPPGPPGDGEGGAGTIAWQTTQW